ncbi:MAG TPA: hypothetical protein ENK15_05405 [Thermopetrobacter sp.]|nr:hypothetical protein [Thermopetrobacter sp.]
MNKAVLRIARRARRRRLVLLTRRLRRELQGQGIDAAVWPEETPDAAAVRLLLPPLPPRLRRRLLEIVRQ